MICAVIQFFEQFCGSRSYPVLNSCRHLQFYTVHNDINLLRHPIFWGKPFAKYALQCILT